MGSLYLTKLRLLKDMADRPGPKHLAKHWRGIASQPS